MEGFAQISGLESWFVAGVTGQIAQTRVEKIREALSWCHIASPAGVVSGALKVALEGEASKGAMVVKISRCRDVEVLGFNGDHER